jgi:hypothetical protein
MRYGNGSRMLDGQIVCQNRLHFTAKEYRLKRACHALRDCQEQGFRQLAAHDFAYS